MKKFIIIFYRRLNHTCSRSGKLCTPSARLRACLMPLCFCAFLLFSNLLEAGLSTTFTEVVFDNLQPGKSYSLKKIFNLPYKVTYTGTSLVDIKLQITPSVKNYIRSGYDTPEDLSWIKLEKTEYKNVRPGETIESDIIITPPDNERMLNQKYQVSIVAETHSAAKSFTTLEFALESFLRFSMAPIRLEATQEEIDKLNLNLNYHVTPQSMYLTNIRLRDMKSKKLLIGSLKIDNLDDNEHQYKLNILPKEEAGEMSDGYQICPNPLFLTFNYNEITVPSNSSKEIKLFLKIPDKKEYRDKKYQFTISTDIKSQEQKIKGNIFSRIYITTKR